jgi:pyruvate,water dikinase
MAIARFDSISDENIRKKIVESSKSFDSPKEFFIRTLSCETGMIAAAFYPKTVVVRFSDFKSNEYSRLIGGELFEHREENPMIGFRGAGRYLDDDYRAREHLGLDNISLMIPFCRTIEEAERILSLLSSKGISRERGYSILMMCEIPSNVILAKEFLSLFDGFSIGSNDLTQLTLGIDRDSEKAASSFSERNPAVLALIRDAIIVAKELNKPIGICGQAPSDDPEFARFIVECGIDSISLNPDSVLRTIPIILEAEKRRKTGFPVQNAESILPKPPQDARTSPAS